MKIIQPQTMAPGIAHYSPGILHHGLIYVSGQLPIRDGRTVSGSIADQTECCLTNIQIVLQEGGSDLDQLLKLSVFVEEISDWDIVNQVIAQMLGQHRPARIIVPVKQLNYGCKIEIDAIAAVKTT
jgi:reactive intermediate/imine deaminase